MGCPAFLAKQIVAFQKSLEEQKPVKVEEPVSRTKARPISIDSTNKVSNIPEEQITSKFFANKVAAFQKTLEMRQQGWLSCLIVDKPKQYVNFVDYKLIVYLSFFLTGKTLRLSRKSP